MKKNAGLPRTASGGPIQLIASHYTLGGRRDRSCRVRTTKAPRLGGIGDRDDPRAGRRRGSCCRRGAIGDTTGYGRHEWHLFPAIRGEGATRPQRRGAGPSKMAAILQRRVLPVAAVVADDPALGRDVGERRLALELRRRLALVVAAEAGLASAVLLAAAGRRAVAVAARRARASRMTTTSPGPCDEQYAPDDEGAPRSRGSRVRPAFRAGELLDEQDLRVLRQRPEVVGDELFELVGDLADVVHRGETVSRMYCASSRSSRPRVARWPSRARDRRRGLVDQRRDLAR